MKGCQLVPFWFMAVAAVLGADVDVQSVDAAQLVTRQEFPLIKEWTVDWQNEVDSGFRSALPADQLVNIDYDNFIHDILVGNISLDFVRFEKKINK